MENEKKILLAEIEKLIAYGKKDPTINPVLLKYLEVSDLISIKSRLLKNIGHLTKENIEWLEQFKKYE